MVLYHTHMKHRHTHTCERASGIQVMQPATHNLRRGSIFALQILRLTQVHAVLQYKRRP